MRLGEGVFVEDGFPMLYGVVGFELSVRQVHHGLSALNGNVHYLVGIDYANVLTAGGHWDAGRKVAVSAVVYGYKQAVAAVICNWDARQIVI